VRAAGSVVTATMPREKTRSSAAAAAAGGLNRRFDDVVNLPLDGAAATSGQRRRWSGGTDRVS